MVDIFKIGSWDHLQVWDALKQEYWMYHFSVSQPSGLHQEMMIFVVMWTPEKHNTVLYAEWLRQIIKSIFFNSWVRYRVSMSILDNTVQTCYQALHCSGEDRGGLGHLPRGFNPPYPCPIFPPCPAPFFPPKKNQILRWSLTSTPWAMSLYFKFCAIYFWLINEY